MGSSELTGLPAASGVVLMGVVEQDAEKFKKIMQQKNVQPNVKEWIDGVVTWIDFRLLGVSLELMRTEEQQASVLSLVTN